MQIRRSRIRWAHRGPIQILKTTCILLTITFLPLASKSAAKQQNTEVCTSNDPKDISNCISEKDANNNNNSSENVNSKATTIETHREESKLAKESKTCKNEHKDCGKWASYGECDINPTYMLNHCKVSCDVCDKDVEALLNPRGQDDGTEIDKKKQGEFGVVQESKGELMKETLAEIQKMEKFMREEVPKPEYDKVRDQCINRHEQCAFWAASGECETNPAYMKLHCAPCCQTCLLIDFDERCKVDPDVKDSMETGELHGMFERIVEDPEYTRDGRLKVLAQPNDPNADNVFGPWIITIDDFITEEECKRLIELGGDVGYARSRDVGNKKFDGTFATVESKDRTSWNAWCTDQCYDDPLAKNVMDKIEKLTGIPETNAEFLQLLRYEEGQFYKIHHDFIPHEKDRPTGPRILTAFLYLNDVEAGGGTNFPRLKLTVMPKRGKLLLWPSVRDRNLREQDHLTFHQALPVEKGTKYGANGWLHLRDFKNNVFNNCA